MTTNDALTKAAPAEMTLAPTTFAEVERFAAYIARSGMAPKGYENKPDAIVVAVIMGQDIGLAPMAALRSIAVINGRPTIWGDGMLAVCMRSPAWRGMTEMSLEEIGKAGYARCIVRRAGVDGAIVEHVGYFSLQDAETAKLLKKEGPWQQYPNRMLQMRARGFACRDGFSDALSGIELREEVEDMIMVTSRATTIEPGEKRPQRHVKAVSLTKGDDPPAESPPAAEPTPDMLAEHQWRQDEIDRETAQREQEEIESFAATFRFSSGAEAGKSITEVSSAKLSEVIADERDTPRMRLLKLACGDELERRIHNETVVDPDTGEVTNSRNAGDVAKRAAARYSKE